MSAVRRPRPRRPQAARSRGHRAAWSPSSRWPQSRWPPGGRGSTLEAGADPSQPADRLEAPPVTTEDARTQVDPLATPRTVRMVRRFEASRSRVFRPLADPEEMVRWFAEEVRGSLGVGTRTTLVFPDSRTGGTPWCPRTTRSSSSAGPGCRTTATRRPSGSSSSPSDTAPSSRSPTAPSTSASRCPRRLRRGKRGLGRGACLAPRLGRLLRGAAPAALATTATAARHYRARPNAVPRRRRKLGAWPYISTPAL